MPCCQGQDFDRMFDARRARKDLRAYSRRGARGATRRLLDAVRASLREQQAAGFTHLDIGGGVGVLQHELVRDGAVHTTAVDASHAYLELLRLAAAERGYEARQTRIEGDFTQVADRVETATVVTLDKVICCYPDIAALVRASARKATAIYGIVVPCDRAWVRALVGLANWLLRRVLRWQFRVFAHSHRTIDRLCTEEGLILDRQDPGLWWCVRLYRRAAG
ncbi:MAG: methyltransferase domain-containing protein [Acidobacteria bacterium]|nr:methyltransferase domain-containing protein [Acidobacteriota bacterium]